MKRDISVLSAFVVAFAPMAHAQPRVVADVGQIALPVAGLAVSAALKDGDGIGDLAKAMATAMVVTHGLKAGIDARRPNGGGHSFPSGHTAVAFTGATFLWKRYGWWAGLPAVGVAVLVASSRVSTRDHHVRDVVAGAAIGAVSAAVFTSRWSRRLAVMPIALRGGGGVFVSLAN